MPSRLLMWEEEGREAVESYLRDDCGFAKVTLPEGVADAILESVDSSDGNDNKGSVEVSDITYTWSMYHKLGTAAFYLNGELVTQWGD